MEAREGYSWSDAWGLCADLGAGPEEASCDVWSSTARPLHTLTKLKTSGLLTLWRE